MYFGLTLLEVKHELPVPAWAFGLIGFGLLMVLMFITLSIGKGRAHS